MENAISKFKKNIASIHWPSKQSLIRDTTTTVIVSAVLSTLIALWTTVIEYGVSWVISLF